MSTVAERSAWPGRGRWRHLALGLWLIGCAEAAPPLEEASRCTSASQQAVSRPFEPIATALVEPRIVVHKAARELRLFDGERLLRLFRVGLGSKPTGRKTREGDRATPEGVYFVCVKNPESQYYLSLGLNYPNALDAQGGFEAGLISKREHDAIVRAERERRKPPWDTALGGTIYIHGEGSSRDWTWGCPALDNPDMNELYAAVRVGTPVEICP